MFGLFHGDGHLMRAEGSFDLLTVHNLGTGPALGSAQDDHRPEGTRCIVIFPRIFLDGMDFLYGLIQRLCHLPMHGHGIITLYEVGLPATAMEEAFYLIM